MCTLHTLSLTFKCPCEATIVPVSEIRKCRLRGNKRLAQDPQLRSGNAGVRTQASLIPRVLSQGTSGDKKETHSFHPSEVYLCAFRKRPWRHPLLRDNTEVWVRAVGASRR